MPRTFSKTTYSGSSTISGCAWNKKSPDRSVSSGSTVRPRTATTGCRRAPMTRAGGPFPRARTAGADDYSRPRTTRGEPAKSHRRRRQRLRSTSVVVCCCRWPYRSWPFAVYEFRGGGRQVSAPLLFFFYGSCANFPQNMSFTTLSSVGQSANEQNANLTGGTRVN